MLKPGTILPTPEEDAQIQAGINADPDAYSLTDAEWEQVKPTVRVGRLKPEVKKERFVTRFRPPLSIDKLHVTHIISLHVTWRKVMPTTVERVRAHRQSLRAAGLRPIQIWVPDTRRAGFAEECARQSQVVRESESESEMLDFIEQSADLDDWA
jgi:hypothetical protein